MLHGPPASAGQLVGSSSAVDRVMASHNTSIWVMRTDKNSRSTLKRPGIAERIARPPSGDQLASSVMVMRSMTTVNVSPDPVRL